jgi:predicted methyltransferase
MRPVISCYQAAPLLKARAEGLGAARSSFDLGRSEVEVSLGALGVSSIGGPSVAWSRIEEVADSDSVCFAIDETGEISPLRIYSDASARSFQLWPTRTSPALLISGFLMHRIRDVAPDEGAARMVRPLGKVHGRVLDTTSGLGYAAIAAARTASEVVTIEIEPVVRELARQNPWSRELFESSRLTLLDGDSASILPTLEPASFSAILHDPPAINLAGDLYSAAFYDLLHRLLTRGGKLFHYIGDANSPSGSRTTRGVVKRLNEAGFSRVTILKDAFGVLASA